MSIHEESRHLFAFREAIRHHVATALEQGRDLYEIVLDDPFREQVATFDRVFKDKLRQDRYATALSIQAASDLTLLLKYMAGRLPSSDFESDFGVKGTPPNILDTFFACITPITGATIAGGGRITANATGCCNSTGTKSAASVRLQRWTRYRTNVI